MGAKADTDWNKHMWKTHIEYLNFKQLNDEAVKYTVNMPYISQDS